MHTPIAHPAAAIAWDERVRALLGGAEGAFPSLKQAAEHLYVSPRSLRRHLAARGCTYQQLLDQERRQRALVYLSSGALPLSEIAFLLGFSDQANFRRAFKKWTGRAPSSFRV